MKTFRPQITFRLKGLENMPPIPKELIEEAAKKIQRHIETEIMRDWSAQYLWDQATAELARLIIAELGKIDYTDEGLHRIKEIYKVTK